LITFLPSRRGWRCWAWPLSACSAGAVAGRR